MKKYIFGIFVMLSLTIFTGQGFCQPPEDFKKPPSKEQIEKIKKRVETLKIWRLTKILDLDEETASRLFPLINKYDKRRFVIEQSMRKDMRKLRKSVDTASPDKLRDIIKRLEDNHRELQEINYAEKEELKDILPVRKFAKFIIFQQDFNREMKEIIAEVRKRHTRKLREKPMGPPHE